MNNVPKWIIKVIETGKLHCSECRKTLEVKSLISVGIQKGSEEPYSDRLCVGLNCSSCMKMTVFELKDMSLLEFAFEFLDKETEPELKKKSDSKSNKKDIFDELSGGKTTRKKSLVKKSKITKREVTDIAKFLKNTKTHEEFLVAMGMSPEQISKYHYKKGEED